MLTWLERIARAIAALFGINVGGNDRTGEVQTLQAQLAACEEQIERYAETVREQEATHAAVVAELEAELERERRWRRDGANAGERLAELLRGKAATDAPAAPVMPPKKPAA